MEVLWSVFVPVFFPVAFAAEGLRVFSRRLSAGETRDDMVKLKVFCCAAASAVIILPLSLLLLCEEADAEVWVLAAHVDNAAISRADLGVAFSDLPRASLKGLTADYAVEGLSLLPGLREAVTRTVVSVTLLDLALAGVEFFPADGAGSYFASFAPFSPAFSGACDDAAFFDFAWATGELPATNLALQKWAFLHTLNYTSLDVFKPNLIDLEAQAWATGGKVTAAAYRPERLSGWDAIKRMRQSGLPYDASRKRERKVEAPSRHGIVVTQVTDSKYYSGYEELDINPSDVFSAAEYNWKQAAVNVTASGLEAEVQNSGKEAIINLLDKRIKNAFRTMKNQISEGIYSDGTGSSSKQITGLQAQVADDPTTGTVGGINRATSGNEFWRNQYNSNATWTSSVIKGYMQDLWIDCTRGSDKPDLVTMDANTYALYWDALTDIQRITHENENAGFGWSMLKFLNADVIYDGDSGHPANTLYLLNTDYIFFRPHVNRNFVALDRRDSVNQDAFVVPIVFAGNLTMSNASLQGVYFKS